MGFGWPIKERHLKEEQAPLFLDSYAQCEVIRRCGAGVQLIARLFGWLISRERLYCSYSTGVATIPPHYVCPWVIEAL